MVLACAAAPTSRDIYRAAYRDWRTADPNLEHDAGTAGAELAPRVEKVQAQATRYGTARMEFLAQSAAVEDQRLHWLDSAPDAPSGMIDDNAANVVATETRNVKRNADVFAADPDAGIRELRTMLERESQALAALTTSMDRRKQAADQVKKANVSVAQQQVHSMDEAHAIEQYSRQASADSGAETAAWAGYYALLADGARGVSASAPAVTASAPAAPKPTVTPLPLARYVGAWVFPVTGGLYHGAQPEFVDLVVHETDGHADGTLFARFKLPPGSTGDPVLRFDFAGDFQPTRSQKFPLTTSEGAKGTIELLPGPAFNLLEVNFDTDPRPGKVHQGNVVLIKK
jgi:hypothetical protein